MSAFFVGYQTIDAAVSLAIRHNVIFPEQANSVGALLLWMNRDAMLARYPRIKGTDEDADYRRDAMTYTFTARNEGDPTLAKSLCCLLYQCSEGDVDKSALFRGFDALHKRTAPPELTPHSWRDPAAVHARREYDAAPWGLCG